MRNKLRVGQRPVVACRPREPPKNAENEHSGYSPPGENKDLAANLMFWTDGCPRTCRLRVEVDLQASSGAGGSARKSGLGSPCWPSASGQEAGAWGGSPVGRRECARMAWTASWARTAARIRIVPAQRGQTRASTRKTRLSGIVGALKTGTRGRTWPTR